MTYGDVKCGSFNKLVGVDSECDSWVLETIHGVASGSATIIWKLNGLIRLTKSVGTEGCSIQPVSTICPISHVHVCLV